MNFDLTDEQKEVKERAAAFVREVCDPLEASWTVDDYDMPPDVLLQVTRKFREYGLRGLSVPKEAGGLGLGAVAKCLVYEEMMKSPVLQGGLTTVSGLLEPNPALYQAPDWQKEKYLYPLLREEKFHQIHISEPDAGSDAARISTTAVRDGENYIINGVKRWAPPPGHPSVKPEYLLCFAVTTPGKGYEGISVLLVDFPNSGVTVDREYHIGAGILGRGCDFLYRDCVVPARNLLGEEGLGFRYMMDQLNRNRVTIAARHAGTARWAQTQAARRAKERVTFGSPLAERQAIQWMLADSEMDIEQMRLLAYKAAWMLDQKLDARKEVAMAKCFAPVAAARVIDRAIQIFGAMGMVKETRLMALYIESRVSQLTEGSTEIMKMAIAREALRAAGHARSVG